MLRRKNYQLHTELPRTPRMLTPDELMVMESEDQLRHLSHEMNRSLPDNPVMDSNILAMVR